MRVHIKPRVQKDKWSLYWKTSMATKTLYLDEFDIDVDPEKTTGKELRALVAETIGHKPEKELCRLESFVEPWELACAPFPSPLSVARARRALAARPRDARRTRRLN